MDDEALRGRLAEAIGSLDCDVSGVSVSVSDGRAVLTGSVRTWFDRDEIDRIVWTVAGLKSVDNRIVEREGGATAEAEQLP